jgi:DNA-binding NarL/FixJ family response regulator
MPPPRQHEVELRVSTCVVAGETLLILSLPSGHDGPLEKPPSAAPDPLAMLSKAQREVLGLVMEGWSHQAIAEKRGTSRRTVDKQIELAYRRLGIGSKLELAGLWCRSSS